MAITALHDTVCAQQRELCLRVVESGDIRPGPRVVASLAAERSAVRALLCHPLVEFAVVRILVTSSTSHVLEPEGQDLVGPTRQAHFVAIGTWNGQMRSIQRVACLHVHCQGKSRLMEIFDGVAILASVLMRWAGELIVVRVLVAVQARCKLDLVNRILAGGQMTLSAFHGHMLPSQRIPRCVVLLHAEERRLPAFHRVTFVAFAFLRPRLELPFVRVGLMAVGAIRKRQGFFEITV